MLGLKQAGRPPSPDHPLGHGKTIYFWSFIVALILFSMGGLFSIYEGLHKLETHEGLESVWLALLILGFSIAAETVSLYGCLREINKLRGRKSLWRWFRESRRSELIVVLGEDLAALAGLLLALAAIVLVIVTGDAVYDAIGSIAIGVLLVAVAIGIGIEIKGLLIGQSVEPEGRQAIHGFLEGREEIRRVFNLITFQLGEDVMVAVKAEMRARDAVPGLLQDINRCEAALKQTFPRVRWVFFEPDTED